VSCFLLTCHSFLKLCFSRQIPQQPGTVGSTRRHGAPVPALPSEQHHPPTPRSQPPTPQSQLPTRRSPPPTQQSQPPIRRGHPPTRPSQVAWPKRHPARLCLGRPVLPRQPPRLATGILLPPTGDQPPVRGHLRLVPAQGMHRLLPTSHALPTAQSPCLLTCPSCPPPQQRRAPPRPTAQRRRPLRPPGRRGPTGISMSCRYHRSRHVLKTTNCPASTAKPSQLALLTRALRH
jgi:hypothetical protein